MAGTRKSMSPIDRAKNRAKQTFAPQPAATGATQPHVNPAAKTASAAGTMGGTITPPPVRHGDMNTQGSNNYAQLKQEYEDRLRAGHQGNQFLQNHQNFAQNYAQNQAQKNNNAGQPRNTLPTTPPPVTVGPVQPNPAPAPAPNPNGYIDPNTGQYVPPGTAPAPAPEPAPAPAPAVPAPGDNGYIDPNTGQYVPPGTAPAPAPAPVPDQVAGGGQIQQPPAYDPNGPNGYNTLAAEYERRIAAGHEGNQFLQQHQNFANNYAQANSGVQPQGGGTPNPQQPPPGGQGNPGQNNPGQALPTGGGSPNSTSNPAGVSAAVQAAKESTGLPNDPAVIEARRILDDQLSAQLMQIGIQRDQIPSMVELVRQRLETDRNQTMENVDENAVARGIFNSGIRTDNRNTADIGFQRGWQDYTTDVQRMYNDLAQQESGANMDWRRGWQDVLNNYSQNLYDNPSSAIASDNQDDYEDPGYDPGDALGPGAFPGGSTKTRNKNKNKNKNKNTRGKKGKK